MQSASSLTTLADCLRGLEGAARHALGDGTSVRITRVPESATLVLHALVPDMVLSLQRHELHWEDGPFLSADRVGFKIRMLAELLEVERDVRRWWAIDP